MQQISTSCSARASVLTLVIALGACGVGPGLGVDAGSTRQPDAAAPRTQVNGTIQGRSFVAAEALFAVSKSSSTNDTDIVISDLAGVCAGLSANQQPSSWRTLILGLSTLDPVTGAEMPITAPGTYTINGLNDYAVYRQTDRMCQMVRPAGAGCPLTATRGQVVVAKVSATNIVGTFDIYFQADHATGSFDAPACPALGSGTGGAPTCK